MSTAAGGKDVSAKAVTMSSRICWGILGTGAIAHRFAQSIRHVSSAEIATVWGRNPATARELATITGAVCAESLHEFLASDVEAVYVATLPDTHAHYSRAILQTGKAVLCEKPVAINLTELRQCACTGPGAGTVFYGSYEATLLSGVPRLLRHLQCNPIGPVRFVRSGFPTVVPTQHRSWDLATSGGALMRALSFRLP